MRFFVFSPRELSHIGTNTQRSHYVDSLMHVLTKNKTNKIKITTNPLQRQNGRVCALQTSSLRRCAVVQRQGLSRSLLHVQLVRHVALDASQVRCVVWNAVALFNFFFCLFVRVNSVCCVVSLSSCVRCAPRRDAAADCSTANRLVSTAGSRRNSIRRSASAWLRSR